MVPCVFDPTLVIIALLSSATVGVGFGSCPTRKAARLDSIETLRRE